MEKAPKRKVSGFKVEFLGAYRIMGFIGYKFKVSTDINDDIELQERHFSQAGDIALSFSKLIIGKNKPVTLYVLRCL